MGAEEVQVVPVAEVATPVEDSEAPAKRDRSNDDVLTKFVVCVVEYSWLVVLITVGISLILGIWTVNIIYDQGADRTFAFGDGGSDRNDIRTRSYDAVQQAQEQHGYMMRTGSNDGAAAGEDPGYLLCGEIRREAGYEEEGGGDKGRRRLAASTASPETSSSWEAPRGNLFGIRSPDSIRTDLVSELGLLPGQRPPTGPVPQSFRTLAKQVGGVQTDGSATLQHRALQTTNQGVCDIFDWGSPVTLLTHEATVHDDEWGSASDQWIPTVAHLDHNQEIRYCHIEAFAAEIDNFEESYGDQFLMRWRGNLTVTEEGPYEFMTESDDGSYLYVDGERVVSNGGFHGARTEVGAKYLVPGQHSITITFFEAGGGGSLVAGFRPAGGTWAPISGVGFKFEAYGCGAPATALDENDELDYSVCDPFAAKRAADATHGPTGPGCNAMCNSDGSGCTGTQTKQKDFFILVFEAVAGSNSYYTQKDDTTSTEYDKYDQGAGDLFTAQNLAEVKRLDAALIENQEACIAKDEDDQSKCDSVDLSGGLAESMANCIGTTVNLDETFDLSELNDASETCKYNPGYKAFCNIQEGPDTTGRCGKIYGMLNFFYPRSMPPLIEQVAQLTGALVADPENIALLLSTDLGCQIQWFTHSLYEGENSFTALFGLLEAVLTSMQAGTLDFNSDLSTMYGAAMCAGLGSASAQVCTSLKGCEWSAEVCTKDDEITAVSERFGQLMCFGDGSGDELTGSTNPTLIQRRDDLAYFFGQPHIKPYLSFYFDEGFSEANPHLKFTRGWLQFGGPMEGFEDPGELREVQEDALVDWFQEYVRPEFRKNSESDEKNSITDGQVEITYLLGSLLETEIISLLVGDVLLAELSFLIVGFYMWFMTGSFWISMFGMLEITISLPLGYWVYTYILGIEYFDPICMLALYVVMAIGADDVFIWFDAYKQSAFEATEISSSLETRFIWAWRKAASAMLVTSLTTCAVFMATATSPLLNIKSFGIFAAIVIFLDYIYVITWLPAATVIYNMWFENTGFCRCSCCCSGPRKEFQMCGLPTVPSSVIVGLLIALPTAFTFSGYFWWLGGQGPEYAMAYVIGLITFVILLVGITVRVAMTAYHHDDSRGTAEFFEGKVTDTLVLNDQVRKALLIGAACIFLPMAIASLFVEPSSKSEEYLPSDHPLQKIITIMNNEFPAAQWDSKVQAEIVFGVDPEMPLDRKGANDLMDYRRPLSRAEQANSDTVDARPQPDTCCGVACSTKPCSQTTPPSCDVAETCYVDSFDWANPQTQQFMFKTCEDVNAATFSVMDRDPTCTQDPCGVVGATCIVKDMILWLGRNCSDPIVANSEEDCQSAGPLLESYSLNEVPNLDCFREGTCLLPSEKANRILWDYYKSADLPEGLIGWSDYTNPDSRVVYMTIRFPIDLKAETFYTTGELREPFAQIEQYVNGLNPPASAGGLPTHRTTTRTWVFMHTQSIYISYAVLGIFCAIGLAYVVLLVATNNLIVASSAVLTILGVCLCVLGSMVLMGWELGMTESICLTILAGFCVDYIVHFAHSFMECPDRSSRTERAAYAMRHMGISVLSGALTSLGASSLLLFCTLQFFFSFGAFFFGTIMLAWLWANFFFIPLLAQFGPEGTYGDLIKSKPDDTGGDKTTADSAVENPVSNEDNEEAAD